MYESLVRSYNPRSGVQRQLSQIVTLPPPVGGWNAKDAVSEISAVKTSYQQAEALVLDNWVPTAGGIQVRKGFEEHVTGLTGDYVESLMPYHPSTGTATLFAATPTIIYDVTTAGAPASSVTLMTNGRWSHVNFAAGGTRVLYICNGADTPRYWNGSAWTTTTFSRAGLTVANLDFVHAHLFRLWFIEKDTLYAWYGDTLAVGGADAITKLDLGALCRLGGKLVAIGSWTRDGGAGTDDWLVFITSMGEVVIYSGTDPTTITGSALVGVYKVAPPLGRRCFLPLGADLAVLTRAGLMSLTQVLAQDESTARASAVTDRISGAFQQAERAGASLFGWQAIELAREQLAIINVPVIERGTQYQYVLNTATGAWCRFKAIDSGCWGVFSNDLYFGGHDGSVYKYNVGYTDNGEPIVAEMQTAFSTFGTPQIKVFNMARPLFAAPPDFLPKVTMRVDYDTTPVSMEIASSAVQGATWDLEDWDSASWDSGVTPVVRWQTVGNTGIAGSVAFAIGASSELVFNGVDVNYEIGGAL